MKRWIESLLIMVVIFLNSRTYVFAHEGETHTPQPMQPQIELGPVGAPGPAELSTWGHVAMIGVLLAIVAIGGFAIVYFKSSNYRQKSQ